MHLNKKHKVVNDLEENRCEIFCLELNEEFLDMMPKAQSKKQNLINWTLSILKTLLCKSHS